MAVWPLDGGNAAGGEELTKSRYPDIPEGGANDIESLTRQLNEVTNWIKYVTREREYDVSDFNGEQVERSTGFSGLETDLATLETTVNAIVTAPTGSVIDYAGGTAPTGWLLCYGQAISRTTYAALFTAIGTTYGVGDGSTTFNLPDLRGRVVAGKDNMGGSSANRLTDQSGGLDGDVLGDTGGSETHTLLTAETPAHQHKSPHVTSGTSGGGYGSDGTADANSHTEITTNNSDGGERVDLTSSTGGDGAHNNVQPTIILNKIIKI